MSQENVEIVQRFMEAYNSRDFEAINELIDPTFEFRSRFVGIESVHRASEGFPSTYFEMLDEAYDRFEVALDEFIDAGAAVLAAGHAEWRGRASGMQGETPIQGAFWLRSRKAFRAETFTDRTESPGSRRPAGASRLVPDRRQVEAVRLRGRTGLGARSAFEQPGELLDAPPARGDVEHRSYQDADHVSHEGVGFDPELEQVATPPPLGEEDVPLEADMIGLGGRESSEVV